MSSIVVPEMLAIQGEGTIATPKHFAENNQETNRQGIDVNVDERTLNEIELPAFEASVKAGAGSVMCAYNSGMSFGPCVLSIFLAGQAGSARASVDGIQRLE